MGKSIVSAVNPGPNDIAQPRSPGAAVAAMVCSTNITVAEDMLPKRSRMSREAASAGGPRSRPCSTASSTERPPGCTAQRSIAPAVAPSRIAGAPARSPALIAWGTRPESNMSKPRSPIFQVMRPAVSGSTTTWKRSSARPTGSALMMLAAQPSANTRNDSICSRFVVCCRCNEHSSRLSTRTREVGSERTMCRASLSALIAA